MTLSIAARITRARMSVILSTPFFGSLLMRLKMIPDDAVPTFCTDGRVIRYSPEFAESLTDQEIAGVLIHEVSHCAQGHLWRMGPRDPGKWNVAADFAINNFLETFATEEAERHAKNHRHAYVRKWTLPAGALLDPQFNDLSAEEIYHRLPTSQDQAASPGCGDFTHPAGEDSGDSLESDWQIAVTQAVAVAKMRGELGASLQRLVGELLAPKVPWRDVLRDFIRQHARDDYAWSHPNRRYLAAGLILPSLHSERMGSLAIAVDTSGSISDHNLAEFQAEIQCALDECAPERIEVIYCDARINSTEEFHPGDTVRLTPTGGGGTRFEPVFEYLEQNEPPIALIYLTDGYGSFPKAEPAYQVLWVSTGLDRFPFGHLVSIR